MFNFSLDSLYNQNNKQPNGRVILSIGIKYRTIKGYNNKMIFIYPASIEKDSTNKYNAIRIVNEAAKSRPFIPLSEITETVDFTEYIIQNIINKNLMNS